MYSSNQYPIITLKNSILLKTIFYSTQQNFVAYMRCVAYNLHPLAEGMHIMTRLLGTPVWARAHLNGYIVRINQETPVSVCKPYG